MRISGFLIICCCCWIITVSQCDAVAVNCEYRNDYNQLYTDLKFTTISGYFCYLMSGSTNSVDVTSIKGSHDAGKGDDDVKILWNFSNNLKTFASIFCQKFKNLEYIWIKYVEIGSIDENSLRNCENLDIINLYGNKLREVPETLLAQNSKLTQVLIWKNDLTTLPENFFQNQNQLEQVELQENEINFLPTKIFNPLVKLQYLSLQNNKLQVLDPEWLVNLKSLKLLGLSQNEIVEVPGGIFKSLKNLEILWLHENKIKTLSLDSFDGLQNLVRLSLNENELSEIPRGVFVPLKNLEWLNLGSNELTVIHSDSFGSHNNLIHIDLQSNEITALDEKFIDNTAVKFLNMTNNLCGNEDIQVRNEIKQKLQNCFENYQPRTEIQTRPITAAPSSLQYRKDATTPTTKGTSKLEFTTSMPSQSNVCGRPMIAKGNIIGGAPITRRSFPWIAALLLNDGSYFCGGTIVTNRKIVTAAHCIQDKSATKPLFERDILVLLGAHNLDLQLESGRIPYAVQDIQMHPKWNPHTVRFDADIAVLVLEEEIKFGRYIKPICLIDQASDIKDIDTGIVVGYGRSEDLTKDHENIPKVINTPIYTNEDCFLKNSALAKFSSKRTFCGGFGNGTGVCHGDSGGGLFVSYEGAYYLRGVVSSSLINFDSNVKCDVDTYSIFTNMLNFTEWVNSVDTDYRR